jgi:peptide methionine sulfoxide reductase MsrB
MISLSLFRETDFQGHVFKGEGYRRDDGSKIEERHCVNSISLKFNDEKETSK